MGLGGQGDFQGVFQYIFSIDEKQLLESLILKLSHQMYWCRFECRSFFVLTGPMLLGLFYKQLSQKLLTE